MWKVGGSSLSNSFIISQTLRIFEVEQSTLIHSMVVFVLKVHFLLCCAVLMHVHLLLCYNILTTMCCFAVLMYVHIIHTTYIIHDAYYVLCAIILCTSVNCMYILT